MQLDLNRTWMIAQDIETKSSFFISTIDWIISPLIELIRPGFVPAPHADLLDSVSAFSFQAARHCSSVAWLDMAIMGNSIMILLGNIIQLDLHLLTDTLERPSIIPKW